MCMCVRGTCRWRIRQTQFASYLRLQLNLSTNKGIHGQFLLLDLFLPCFFSSFFYLRRFEYPSVFHIILNNLFFFSFFVALIKGRISLNK